MTYFADLTPYGYRWIEPHFNEKLLNVGWLDPSVMFERCSVADDLLEKLFRLSQKPVNLTRGYHHCPYQSSSTPDAHRSVPAQMKLGPWTISVGSGEIRVPGTNGIVYAAPTLIGHYIQTYESCPPQEFLPAVANLRINNTKL